MVTGGPGPGKAAGTVWRPKSLQNPNEKNIFRNRGDFPESSITEFDKNDPGKSPLFVKIFFRWDFVWILTSRPCQAPDQVLGHQPKIQKNSKKKFKKNPQKTPNFFTLVTLRPLF